MNDTDWSQANQRYLSKAILRVRGYLDKESPAPDEAAETDIAEHMETSPALLELCRLFSLSAFERDLLLLCVGVELDGEMAAKIADLQQGRSKTPSFSLALAYLPNAYWSALAPASSLRRWRLIEPEGSSGISHNGLRIDERILHYLTGVSYLDARLQGLISPVESRVSLLPSQQSLADHISRIFSTDYNHDWLPVIQLCGPAQSESRAIAAAGCAALGVGLNSIRGADIPATPGEREALARLWEREAALDNCALLIECDQNSHHEQVSAFLNEARGLFLANTPEPLQLKPRTSLLLDTPVVDAPEQKMLWREALGPIAKHLNGGLDMLVTQFSFNADDIRVATRQLQQQSSSAKSKRNARLLWQICRSQARRSLDALAQKLEPRCGWEDLVLPPAEKDYLREIAGHVRQRFKVYETWGFAEKSLNGLGISALFSGPSGTGKTLTAEVLANELLMDLYRIDLSQVISKYIGETEKNLNKVFSAAEHSGAILLFDEADALFGKRSEVKDSHDRYANIEVSYLLQRMESYRGLAILTTNHKEALDSAFMRRLNFVVRFPFPDNGQREEIWRRIFPKNAPKKKLLFDKLAKMDLSGGNIRNIALYSAFLAAEANQPINMDHLLHAARREYAKLDRTLSTQEFGQ